MQLLNILLQATSTVTESSFSFQRLVDAGLSLGILAIIAKVLWSRQKQMEDRLNKYLEEDRKEMMEVIQNNTKAFEQVANSLKEFHK